MNYTALDILVLLLGFALFVAILIAALTYRELIIKRYTTKQDDSGWPIINAYRDTAKAERERGLKNNDKTG